jgi:hypothetical protein
MHLNARIRRQPIDKRHDQPFGKRQITESPAIAEAQAHLDSTDRDASSNFACLFAPIAM